MQRTPVAVAVVFLAVMCSYGPDKLLGAFLVPLNETCSPQTILILPICYCPMCPIQWDRVQLNWTWCFSRLGIDNSIRIVVRAAAADRRAPPQPLTRARGRDTRARYRVSARAEQGAQLGVALLAPLGAQPLAPVGAVPQRFLRAFSVMRTHQCAGRGRTESRAGRSKG